MSTNTYQIIARREAAAKGEKYFYTGRPCARKHYSLRFVTSGSCVVCSKVHRAIVRNGYTPELDHCPMEHLYVPRLYGRDDRIRLRHLIQAWIFADAQARGATVYTEEIRKAAEAHAVSTPNLNDPKETP